MSGELHYMGRARRRKLMWVAFYIVLAIFGVVALLATLDKVHERVLPAGKIELEFSSSKYVLGEPVVFTLTNHLNTPIYVPNRCPSEPLEVYRKEDGHWNHIHAKAEDGECSSKTRQIVLQADTATTASFAPWQQMFDKPGLYRVVADVDNYESIVYRDFWIVEKPLPTVQLPPATEETSDTPEPANDQPQENPHEEYEEEHEDEEEEEVEQEFED